MPSPNRPSGQCFPTSIDDREIIDRLERIRAAKRAVDGRELTADELDRLIEPVDCARTRARLTTMKGG